MGKSLVWPQFALDIVLTLNLLESKVSLCHQYRVRQAQFLYFDIAIP
jgi:hypothetical protein